MFALQPRVVEGFLQEKVRKRKERKSKKAAKKILAIQARNEVREQG